MVRGDHKTENGNIYCRVVSGYRYIVVSGVIGTLIASPFGGNGVMKIDLPLRYE